MGFGRRGVSIETREIEVMRFKDRLSFHYIILLQKSQIGV